MEENVQKAIEVVKNGGIIIFPTDTVFGIGCRIDNESAVNRLFAIKQRSKTQAPPVLVNSIEMAQEYLLPIPQDVIDRLMKNYWPGALTIVLPCKIEKVSSWVRGNSNTLGIRVPNHQIILEIIRGVGVPIIGTSANFHGAKTPKTVDELDPDFVKKVDMIVEGVCNVGISSTVVDCSQKPWKILRQGSVTLHL